MPQFFIDRPVFAWVVAAFITLFGIIAIPQLPVARFPSIAPPSVSVFASYSGASAQTVNETVVVPIERELTGVKNLLYFSSSADSTGSANITLTFAPGTDPELAMVDVQNRLKGVEPQLPPLVRQGGLAVESASAGFLAIVTLTSEGNRLSALDLEDYLAKYIVPELKRVKGVGRLQSFGTEKAMRIWVDPLKLEMLNLSIADVTSAIQGQNLQIAPGQLGAGPTVPGQTVTVPLTVRSTLSTPEEFGKLVVKGERNGATVLLSDVARVEIGAQTSSFSMLQNGNQATGAAIQLSPGANAVATANAIKARLAELKLAMPQGMTYALPFDTSPFIKVSIEKVIYTLFEAMALVFVVMFLFLQNIRYTIIPAIVAPVALLGTFAVMFLAGYSINVLTMFGMVLAIGIIVDDAIVVVENVERIMASEGLSPKDATRKAMKEITGAVIGITAVLVAVFIPMGLASGSVGAIYRQFTLSMAVSILFSAFLALTLTPALCANLLKPVQHGNRKWAPFALFDRGVDKVTRGYGKTVAGLLRRGGRMMALYVVLVGALIYWFPLIPTAFVPDEDQGNYTVSVALPADATEERTAKVTDLVNAAVTKREATQDNLLINGFSDVGSGANAATAYVTLKDWKDRADLPASEEVAAMTEALADVPEGSIQVSLPGAIEELGGGAGFSFVLQDRGGKGLEALMAAKKQLLEAAASSPKLASLNQNSLPNGPNVELEVDRNKAQALGVSFQAISETLGTAISSSNVGEFSNAGKLQQVIVQADARYRMQVDDVLKLFVRNDKGGMVALGEVVTARWNSSPRQISRHNGYLSVDLGGEGAKGVASGDAMAEVERLVRQLPEGFGIEWTGESLQERDSGAQMPLLMALSMLVVFLVLAALYESWTVPISVLLVVPLGIIGSVAAVQLGGQSNDVFFKVGLITVIGLSAKNAILIVEFAKAKLTEGWTLRDAIVEAGRLRIRPIVMTSLAFALGVLPLVHAHGASAETQKALGTGVLGGVIAATLFALLFVPVFYYVVMSIFGRKKVSLAPIVTPTSTGSDHA
ncbi:multidrug efflux RND transporter permease subunit [Devosia sp.]|uniref:multidrug efflux RND transporter permease subunit n=1 Tax=Devosia sp. TaxID=1871048 RepID=UPI0019FC9375|nr:multidrug efflux RND transporter permease subunit [Devosia sp.]MBE0579568.1 multidrug efflux RND transporter permease subunit [Devosia sp.]